MNALIVLNGILPSKGRIQTHLKEADIILCANGGSDRALAGGIKPDYVIGDLDSVSENTRARLPEDRFIHRPSQYSTDLEKTLDFAIEKNIESVVVVGITGNRLDHQICNLNILEKFCRRLEITTVDDGGLGCFVREELKFEGEIGQGVSIFAFRRSEGITSEGLRYPLENAAMEWAVNDGLSNEIVENPVEIKVQKGVLFVYRVWLD